MGRLTYQFILKRTSTYCLAMVCTAVVFERIYDRCCEYIFEKCNEGRLWMHIKHEYEGQPEDVTNVASAVRKPLKNLSSITKTSKEDPVARGEKTTDSKKRK